MQTESAQVAANKAAALKLLQAMRAQYLPSEVCAVTVTSAEVTI